MFDTTPLFCCVIHELRPKKRDRLKNYLPHKPNRVPYLEIKLEMASNAHFCQFSSSASFSSVYFVYLFLHLLLLLLLLLLLRLLLLLLNDQIANLFGAFTLFQGTQLCFFLCCKNFLIRPPYSAASYMNYDRKERGRLKNYLPHKPNRVPYLEIKLEIASNAHFCQFSSSASFSSVYFVCLFLLLLLLLLRLLLLLLLNDYYYYYYYSYYYYFYYYYY